jgi:Flp pilus assembly protein TadD
MLHYKRFNNRWAIQAWRPLIDQDSDLSDLETPPAVLLLGYGRALLDDGRPAEALGQLERAVRLDSTDDARNALAEACNSLGDCPRAVALWKQVVERNSANRPAREGLAQAALEERAPVEARRWLEPLLSQNDLHSSTAFLAQRAARMAGDKEAAALWTARANVLREREIRIRNLEQSLRDSPRSFSSRCVHAHRFASEGNLSQALVLAEDLLTERPDDPFVSQLTDAIHNHGPLPPLESIPFEQF